MTKDYSTTDYNAKLAQDYDDIRAKVRGGMLPLVARIPAIDKAVSAYVEAQDAHYEELRRKAAEEGGDASTAVPIQLRDATALHRMADLVLHEELTWSHPDKMSIVEYPVMSEWQEIERNSKQQLTKDGEVEFGDRHGNGRRNAPFITDDGRVGAGHNKMVGREDDEINKIGEYEDLFNAIDDAVLTDRQREVIELIYFGNDGAGMSQEEAGKVLGISDRGLRYHLNAALTKIRRNFKESTS